MTRLLAGACAAFALLVPAAGATTYTGTITDSADAVTVKVKHGRLVKFATATYASGGLDNRLTTIAYPPKKGRSVRVKADGSFKAVFSAVDDLDKDKRVVKGRVKGGRVTGSFSVKGLCSA